MARRTIILNGSKFTLGEKYKDTLLGNEGIAISGVSYLTACDQLQIIWNDFVGRPVSRWYDVTRLAKVKIKKSGGPAPHIPSRHP